MMKIKRWAFLECVNLILVEYEHPKDPQYIETYTIAEAKNKVPHIVDEIIAKKL